MLPQELKQMDESKEIVSYQAFKPIMCDKIKYYLDPAFEGRVGLPTPRVPPMDVKGMLNTMRGITPEDLKTFKQLEDKTGADLIKEQPLSVHKALDRFFGFDCDFIGDVKTMLQDKAKKSKENKLIRIKSNGYG